MNAAAPLLCKVQSFLDEQGIRGGPMVLAVSGGPDSVALLRAIVRLREAVPPDEAPLLVAHLNHRLRGTESDGDEQFVQDLVERLKVESRANLHYRCERIDVAARAKAECSNVEDLARRLRYDWLSQVAQETGSSLVTTGHTMDDQAETVLHRLIRGTGLKGLRGIAPRRRLTDRIELIRPLLHVKRSEVLAFLQTEGRDYREDSSNLSRDYTRNRIRHELIPLLTANYNPEIVTTLTQLAEQAGEAFVEQEAGAQALLSQAELPRAGQWVVLDGQRLGSASRNLRCEMFRLLWVREGWRMANMGFEEWNQLAEFCDAKKTATDLPDGIRVRRRERVVLVGLVS